MPSEPLTAPAALKPAMLEVSHLVKEFTVDRGERVRAVSDVSFTVPQGSVLTLLGPSGCGKTTTLRSIAGLEKPTGGSIRIRGKDMFDATQKVFVAPQRRPIGMVFQSYAIWPQMRVEGNVSFPLRVLPRRQRPSREEIRREVARVLVVVQLSGYEERQATALSGGQQQRLAIARALLKNAPILLLDEATSALDSESERMVQAALERLAEGRTVVAIAHRLSTILNSDCIVVMDQGRIVATGRHEELLQKSDLYRSLYELQFHHHDSLTSEPTAA